MRARMGMLWVVVVAGVSLASADGVGVADDPAAPSAPAFVRAYALYSPGLIGSFPSAGEASFRKFDGAGGGLFLTGREQRSTPLFVAPLVVDLEVGLVIDERFRVAVQGVPVVQLLGHVGVDLARLPRSQSDDFGALTLWLGGGYQRLNFLPNGTQLYGAVVSVRATLELTWGLFILRPELFARLQLVTKYDEENDSEGNYWTYAAPLPTVQLGVKLGIGITWPR